ncbi:MAG: archease [Nanoarchaeota archaeon]
MKFKFLSHTADIKFQAYGETLNKVFENSALALLHSIHEGKIKSKRKRNFSVKGKDLESLMYNFLEEFLYLIDAEHFIASKVKAKLSQDKKTLSAEISGDKAENYNIEMHVKAVTYNDMFVKKIKNQWAAQVVVDV